MEVRLERGLAVTQPVEFDSRLPPAARDGATRKAFAAGALPLLGS